MMRALIPGAGRARRHRERDRVLDGLADLLSRSEAEAGTSLTDRVLERARALQGGPGFDDDFLLFEASFT